MESSVEMDVEELRSELWQILKTDPAQHLFIMTSTVEAGRLEKTLPGSLAARISICHLASARKMQTNQKWKVELITGRR